MTIEAFSAKKLRLHWSFVKEKWVAEADVIRGGETERIAIYRTTRIGARFYRNVEILARRLGWR